MKAIIIILIAKNIAENPFEQELEGNKPGATVWISPSLPLSPCTTVSNYSLKDKNNNIGCFTVLNFVFFQTGFELLFHFQVSIFSNIVHDPGMFFIFDPASLYLNISQPFCLVDPLEMMKQICKPLRLP